MRFRIGRTLAGAVAIATATTMASAGNASSDEGPGGIVWDHVWSGPGVKVYFEEHGDVVSVCDTSTNGHSAWVYVMDEYADYRQYTIKATNGKGSCKVSQASQGGYHNMWEGDEFEFNFEGNGGQGSYIVTSVLNDH